MIDRRLTGILFAVPWIAAALSILFLAALRYPLSGVFSAETGLDGASAWINPFLPAERTTSPGPQDGGWIGQRLINDPVYFTTRIPGPYRTVRVTMEYRVLHQPLAEFGVVRDAEGKELELYPLYSSELDPATWQVAAGGYLRTGTPASKLSSPDPAGLSVWDASSTEQALRDPDGPELETHVSLRGSHDLYLVPTSDLRLGLTFQAVNRRQGGDTAVIRVSRGDEELQTRTISISGSRETGMGAATDHAIALSHVAAGVYHVSITASDDVFIRDIRTPSTRWVVGPRLVFGDVVGYEASAPPARAWTNSRHIVAETFHPEGLQDVHFGDVRLRVTRTHTAVRGDRTDPAAVTTLTADKGDMRFVGDGFFALREGAFFEPKPKRFTDGTRVETEGIFAVRTPYVQPRRLPDGWLESSFTFPIDPSLETLRFVVSAPGIASRSGAVDVRKIRVEYVRPAQTLEDWWLTLRQELSRAWHRL